VILTLPWACLLHDNHRLMPVRGRLITSPQYRKAKEAAQWKGDPLAGDVKLHAKLYFPDRRKRDVGNYRKLVTDALKGIAYSDDSQIVSETWDRAGYDKSAPRAEIVVLAA
jgi:Holliday junction resolvase RusA-like endonuclease